MKGCSLVLTAITNILTHKTTVTHKFSLTLTKDNDCCFLYNIFPIMHYDTAWFVGLLGRIAFSPRANRSRVRLQSGPRPPLQGGLGTLVWSDFGAHPSATAAFTPAQTNRTKRDNKL